MITRSKAWSGQPSDRVASSREGSTNFPRRPNESRQDNAVVVDSAEVGSPSISGSTANGVHQVAGFTVSKCNDTRCMTCPKLITEKYFTSNITHQKFNIINHSGEYITCHLQNYVYLLS